MILGSEGFRDAGLAAFRRLANGLDQRQSATGIGSADQRLNPVSYTHLDVYKRQELDAPARGVG